MLKIFGLFYCILLSFIGYSNIIVSGYLPLTHQMDKLSKLEVSVYSDLSWVKLLELKLEADSNGYFSFEVPNETSVISIYLGYYQPYLLYLDGAKSYDVSLYQSGYLPNLAVVNQPRRCLQNKIVIAESLFERKKLKSKLLYANCIPKLVSKSKADVAVLELTKIETELKSFFEDSVFTAYWQLRKQAFFMEHASSKNKDYALVSENITWSKVLSNQYLTASLLLQLKTQFQRALNAAKSGVLNIQSITYQNDTLQSCYDLIVLKHIVDYSQVYPKENVDSAKARLKSMQQNTSIPKQIRTLAFRILPVEIMGKAASVKAPVFELPDLNGVPHKLEDFKGEYVLLDFWAVWCAPCKKEMELMPDLIEKFKDDLQLISISVDELPATAKKFIEKKDYKWLVLSDPGNELTKVSYDVKYYPKYVLIDKAGNLVNDNAPLISAGFEDYFRSIINDSK